MCWEKKNWGISIARKSIWAAAVTRALIKLEGEASLDEIYPYVRDIVKKDYDIIHIKHSIRCALNNLKNQGLATNDGNGVWKLTKRN